MPSEIPKGKPRCKLCNNTFTNRSTLSIHRWAVHKELYKKPGRPKKFEVPSPEMKVSDLIAKLKTKYDELKYKEAKIKEEIKQVSDTLDSITRLQRTEN